MTDREEEEERWREQQLSFARYVQMRAWALSSELPDLTYDPTRCWAATAPSRAATRIGRRLS
jgi:hypothetical protein